MISPAILIAIRLDIGRPGELEIELIQTHVTQKPMPRVEVVLCPAAAWQSRLQTRLFNFKARIPGNPDCNPNRNSAHTELDMKYTTHTKNTLTLRMRMKAQGEAHNR